MTTIRLASATRVALSASSSGGDAPTDDGVSYALLDLSAEVPSVVESKIRTILPRFAARLFLQGELRLIIASGRLEPKAAASVVADVLDAEIPLERTLGVVLGESLLDRLEELAIAGCSLERWHAKGHLLDEPIPPAAIWASTGAGPIVESLAAGSSIVVTQAADIGTMAIAAAAETFAWPFDALERYAEAAAAARFALQHQADALLSNEGAQVPFTDRVSDLAEESVTLPDLSYAATFREKKNEITTMLSEVKSLGTERRVVATIPAGAALRSLISLPSDRDSQLLRDRLQEFSPAGVSLSIMQVDDRSFFLQVLGQHTADVVEAAQHLELLCEPQHGLALLKRPLLRDITPCFQRWNTEVPLELLEYGVDVRRTPDWLDG